MAAWAVSALRLAHPEADITWAVDASCVPVIDQETLVQNLQIVHRSKWKKARWSPLTWKEQLDSYLKLKTRDFDLGVDFHGHSKTALALKIAHPKKRIATFGTDYMSKRLNPVAPQNPDIHIVEQHLAALNLLAEPGLQYELPELPIMPKTVEFEGSPNGEYITIMTGASNALKSLSPESLQELGQLLLAKGEQVAFVGGPNDPVIELTGCHHFVGKLNLSESASLIAKSKLHIAADTGTGHIASAYGVPTVTIFGLKGHEPHVYRPYGPLSHVICDFDYPRQNSGRHIYEFLLENELIQK